VTTEPPAGSGAEFVVRELRWTDFDALSKAWFLLFEERTVQRDIGITLYRTRPSAQDEVTWFANLYRQAISGEAIVAVAEQDGRAVGSCTVHRVGPSEDSETAHMGDLGILVHRDHRGRGIGRALLSSALAQCRGKFELVRLSVFSVNRRARKLYEEFGFVYVGTLPRAIRRGDDYFDEDLMVADLTGPHANR
jgi:RimJ/RimL family protein N-acetyltransferase